MARPKKVQNTSLLGAALEGLEIQKHRIDGQIREVRAMLGHRGPGRRPKTEEAANPSVSTRKRRTLSAAARKRIAAAQKARWAKFRKTNPVPEE